MEKYSAQISQYEEFCREMGEIPANVALAWLLANPVVTAPIVGPRKMEQLTESLRAVEIKFGPDQMAKLDEIWPGPKGESPEAFAW
jgi:aryl-alcohol dehydrogenase-like predicted oxidoreductase